MPSTLLVQPTAATLDKASKRIPTLDGWRGVAIVIVLLSHLTAYEVSKGFKYRFWINLGSFGVDIFFVLSGYIITTGLIREREISGKIDLLNFYRRRAFRILPLVLVYLFSLCIISRFTDLGGFHWQELVSSLFFFRNYQYAATMRDVSTAHFWSLSVEEHFYLVWPAIFLWLRNRRALWFAIISASVSALWRFHELSDQAGFHLFPAALLRLRQLQTHNRLDGLFLGAALALLLTSTRVQTFIPTNVRRVMLPLLLPAIVLSVLIMHGGPSFILYLLVVVALAYTLIVKEGLMFWWLNLRPLVWIGEISYSLYIWQQIFLLHPLGRLPLGRLNVVPFNLACVFIVATCSFYFIERPAIEFGRRLYARRLSV